MSALVTATAAQTFDAPRLAATAEVASAPNEEFDVDAYYAEMSALDTPVTATRVPLTVEQAEIEEEFNRPRLPPEWDADVVRRFRRRMAGLPPETPAPAPAPAPVAEVAADDEYRPVQRWPRCLPTRRAWRDCVVSLVVRETDFTRRWRETLVT
jgi:hypothetical protein